MLGSRALGSFQLAGGTGVVAPTTAGLNWKVSDAVFAPYVTDALLAPLTSDAIFSAYSSDAPLDPIVTDAELYE
jgi:hypothetical protein